MGRFANERPARARVAGALLAVLLSACGSSREEPRSLQGAVLILLDTVRADRLSCYGAERRTSPRIDALAADGVLFENAITYAPWTLPSMRAMLSGSWNPRVDGQRLASSLVEPLRDAGYRTAAFTEGGFLDRKFGFDVGFESYSQETGPVRLASEVEAGKDLDSLEDQETVRRTFSAARKWLEENEDERFFLLVHTYEPHTPYVRKEFTGDMDPGAVGDSFRTDHLNRLKSGEEDFEAEREYVRALYDGGIRESDRYVGELLDTLAELGLDDRTLVVVTSDHGEELGSHYPTHLGNHGHTLLDHMMRVPLVVRDPLTPTTTPRVSSAVRTVDILPTVADRLGVALTGEREGASLAPLMKGANETGRIAFGGGTKEGPPRLFVRHLGYKYIYTQGSDRGEHPLLPAPPRKQLYDLAADPEEKHNLFEEDPKRAREVEKLLRGFKTIGSVPESIELGDDLDEELRARLSSLGYL